MACTPTPIRWHIPTALSPAEERIAQSYTGSASSTCWDAPFGTSCSTKVSGGVSTGVSAARRRPARPALLAMVTLLQAYDQWATPRRWCRGSALHTVATCAVKTQQIPRVRGLREAGVTLLGAASLQAALDI